jgi:hypothetical protein
MRTYPKKTLHKKGLVEWLRCRPWVQTPVPYTQKNLLTFHFSYPNLLQPAFYFFFFCLCEFDNSRNLVEVESYNTCSFMIGLFHFVTFSRLLHTGACYQDLFPFLRMNTTPLYGHHTFCGSTHVSIGAWLRPHFGHHEQCCDAYEWENYLLKICFQVFWVDTPKWNCWIIR